MHPLQVDAAALARDVAELVARGILQPADADGAQVAFCHNITQEVVYRRCWRSSAGNWLAALPQCWSRSNRRQWPRLPTISTTPISRMMDCGRGRCII
ncbi:MAG: hypothetical protein R2851_18550 [Caldilineaceae bacterium]